MKQTIRLEVARHRYRGWYEWARAAGWGVTGMTLLGCTGANTYTTPRTLEPWDVQAFIAPEVVVRPTRDEPRYLRAFGQGPLVYAIPPALGVRIGLPARLEVGVLVSDFIVPNGAEAKWGFARSRWFDAALHVKGIWGPYELAPFQDEGRQISEVAMLHAITSVALNATPSVALVATPGAFATWGHYRTAGARLGGGVQVRLSERFAVFPEATWLRELTGADTRQAGGVRGDASYVTVGLGLLVGHLPEPPARRGSSDSD